MSPEQLNQQCIDRLKAEMLESRVAVIGSGPSSPYIAPLSKLREELARRCGIGIDPSSEFWEFSERAFSSNPNEYFNVIRETYDETPHWIAKVYRHLANIPFRGFATLNYDEQLPSEFRFLNPDPKYFSVYPPRPGQNYAAPLEFLSPPQRLIALHGYCDPENAEWEKQLILKASDYNRHYIEAPSPLFHWWGTLLLATPCIFIGTSLREPGLYRVIQHYLREHRDRLLSMRHLHVVAVKPDIKTRSYDRPGKTFSAIDQIYFDPIDSRYSGLLTILAAFSNLPLDRPSPRSVAPTPITATDRIDFNFI